jgi:hypothetical protein
VTIPVVSFLECMTIAYGVLRPTVIISEI